MRVDDKHVDVDISKAAKRDGSAKVRLRDVHLPSALKKNYGLYVVGCIASFIVAAVTFLLTRSPSSAFFVFLSGYCAYSAVDMLYAYGNGKIEELAVICSGLHKTIDKHEVKAVFYTDSEPPEFHEFYVSSKRSVELQENMAYVVYYRDKEPKRLLGFAPV